MKHYATLFDHKYAAKGIAMYRSLKKHSSEPFTLHVLPLDYRAYEICEHLMSIDDTRIHAWVAHHPTYFKPDKMPYREWCWSLASQFTEQLLNSYFSQPHMTYLDADLFFFSDPKPVHDEIGQKSIAIIPHRFIPEKRYLEVNGIYNVGWVSFKDDMAGKRCLAEWAKAVRERCDETTCGDQKYLDTWPTDYPNDICIIKNIGANVAPWNVGNWRVMPAAALACKYCGEISEQHNGDCIITNDIHIDEPQPDAPRLGNVGSVPIIFYHFHEFVSPSKLTNYPLRHEDIEFIYKPYIEAYNEATELIGDRNEFM